MLTFLSLLLFSGIIFANKMDSSTRKRQKKSESGGSADHRLRTPSKQKRNGKSSTSTSRENKKPGAGRGVHGSTTAPRGATSDELEASGPSIKHGCARVKP